MANWLIILLHIITIIAALITALVIWWQLKQLRKQSELQVLIDSFREWNSDRMLKIRSDSINNAETDEDLDKKERVLEFLEKIASYYRRGVINKELIWDTIGWYIMRYYFYNRTIIDKIRNRWDGDITLYCDLPNLYMDLLEMEKKNVI